jgi:hypothetical protein
LRIRIRDLVSLSPWIQDQGWVKNQDPDPGSKMNITDHISENLETIFCVKKLFVADPDTRSGIFLILDPEWRNSDLG